MLLLRLESVSKEAVAEDLKDSEESFVVDWRKRQDGSKTISCRWCGNSKDSNETDSFLADLRGEHAKHQSDSSGYSKNSPEEMASFPSKL